MRRAGARRRAGRHLRGALGSATAAPGVREIGLWLLVGAVVAVLMALPLARAPGDGFPAEQRDPSLQAWQLGWLGHALVDGHGVWDANAFWPERRSLAFSDSLLGYAPAGLVGTGPHAAVVRYNLLFLFAGALAFAGAAVLARELGAGRLGAAVAGLAFAYPVWRIGQYNHLNILSTGGIPLALALLVGGYRRRRPRRVVAGWLVATWQMSLGFALGVYFFYVLAALAVVAVAVRLWRWSFRLDRRTVLATVAGVAVFGGCTWALAAPYRAVLEEHPEVRRAPYMVEFFSPPPRGLLAAPEASVWGDATRFFRRDLPAPDEQSIFPGFVLLVLCGAGIAAGRLPRGLRAGLALGVGTLVLLSFGLRYSGVVSYRPFYELLPGLDGLRTPGRLMTFATVGGAVLAAFGAERLADAVAGRLVEGRRRRRPRDRALVATVVLLALALALGIEGRPQLTVVPVAAAPAGQAGLPGPQLHLPSDDLGLDSLYMLWSTDGFPRLGNGYSGFLPRRLRALRERTQSFPDAESVQLLRSTGFRLVVVHPEKLVGSRWLHVLERPIAGLGITRESRDGVVVFDLDPGAVRSP